MQTTRELLDAWNEESQTGRPDGLGPSDQGSCQRALAYRLHHVAPTDEREFDAAIVGTMIHQAYAEIINTKYASWERQAELPLQIQGLSRVATADDVWWEQLLVTDLKTLDPSRFDNWKDNGPPESVWEQITLYGLAVADQSGTDDWTMRVASVCRRTGRAQDYLRPWDRWLAEELRDSLVELERRLLAIEPEQAVKQGNGRASAPCAYCKWTTLCLGESDPEPVEAETLTEEQKEIARNAAEQYLTALKEKTEADARQKQARLVLAEVEGDLGGYTVKWSGGREKTETDVPAALELLERLEYELPVRSTTTAKRIIVHRV